MVFPSSRLLRGSPILGIFPPTLVTLAPVVTFRVSFSTRLSLGRSSTVSGLISTCWNSYPSWSPSSSGAPPYRGPVLFSSVTTTTASSPLTLVARGLPVCNGVCVKFGFFPHFMTEMTAVHVPGRHNTLADHLSRWHLSPYHADQFQLLTSDISTTQVACPSHYFDFQITF